MLGSLAARSRPAQAGARGARPQADGGADRDRQAAGAGAIVQAIQRLAVVVDQETAALRDLKAVDLNDFSNKKNQALLELDRAMRTRDGASADAAVQASLADLRAKLERNRRALKVHLEAVHEIVSILSDAIRAADSDGTYLPSVKGPVRAAP